MKKLIVGNWKMHGAPEMARTLVEAVAAQAKKCPAAEVVVCPPFTLLRGLAVPGVALGGQDCHAQREGAHTGDISAPMLKSAGCAYVIVGHSERRAHHGETDETVRQKAAAAIEAGLIPIICIGETLKEREAGRAMEIVGRQVAQSLPDSAAKGRFVLAYEPVWAIGTGKTPTPDDICQMHAHIISAAAAKTGLAPARISVLYGGSVNAGNAAGILATEGVSGVLVGGASLKAEEFCKIIESA